MTAKDILLAWLTDQIGYIEKASNKDLDSKTANAGTANFTKYARDIDALGDYFATKVQGQAWCTSLVNDGFIQCFGKEKALEALYLPLKNKAYSCTYAVKYYQDAGRFFTDAPHTLDQIFFRQKTWKHTGMVTGVDDNFVYTIEGNTSQDGKGTSNKVCAKKYYLDDATIGGYGRPNWSVLEEANEVDKLIDAMTDEQAYRILLKAMNHANTLPVPNWAKAEWNEAKERGITDGSAPQGLTIRCQTAAMILRSQKKVSELVADYITGAKK